MALLQVVLPLDKKKVDVDAASLVSVKPVHAMLAYMGPHNSLTSSLTCLPPQVEIGPRMCLNPIKIFEGSFGGPTLYDNPAYVSPNAVSGEGLNGGEALSILCLIYPS